MTPASELPLVDRLRAEAAARGFTLFGVAPATDADGFGRFERWLDAGYAGEMTYLHKHREQRRNPAAVVAGVRSVVMLGMEYSSGMGFVGYGVSEDGTTPHPIPDTRGRVAAYAQGPDYHRLVWDHLNALAAWLTTEVPGSYAHGTCDSAPLLERDFARRAGLGWFGKNTMLINTRRGSFFFLAGLLTTVELPPSTPHTGSHCGTCTACLDACPTHAFPEPGVLDATKCVSYLTIELRGPIPEELRPKVGDWLFGCDVCQEVCPWNRDRGVRGTGFPGSPDLAALDPVELLTLTAGEFKRRFAGTSLLRTRRTGLLRNACVVLGNTGDERALPALEKATADADGVIAEAATWAVGRIVGRRDAGPAIPGEPGVGPAVGPAFHRSAPVIQLTLHPDLRSEAVSAVPPALPPVGGAGVPPVTYEKLTRRRLPHWQVAGATYFLTWRCAAGVTLTEHERDVVLSAIRHWDATRWDVFAAVVMPDHVHVLACALAKGDGRWDLAELLHSVKSFSAHQIAKQRRLKAGGTPAPPPPAPPPPAPPPPAPPPPAPPLAASIWQDERYDRWMRDEDEMAEKWEYIAGNPVKAGLVESPEQYRWLYQKATAD